MFNRTEYYRRYRELHKEQYKAYQKEYQRKYKETHKEELSNYIKSYIAAHKEEIKMQSKLYKNVNKDKIKHYLKEYHLSRYCKDYTQIENYDKAKADNFIGWHCHHRDEIRVLPSGMIALRSATELKENGRYYNCPPNELIFLTETEHKKLHYKYHK